MTQEEKITFLKELHDLFEKYNVEISVKLEGDTHGLDVWLEIEHRLGTSFKYETIAKTHGEICSAYLKQFITI